MLAEEPSKSAQFGSMDGPQILNPVITPLNKAPADIPFKMVLLTFLLPVTLFRLFKNPIRTPVQADRNSRESNENKVFVKNCVEYGSEEEK